jgi:hypothetical protein
LSVLDVLINKGWLIEREGHITNDLDLPVVAIDGDHEGISELARVGAGDGVGEINIEGMKEGVIFLVGNSVGVIDGLGVEDRNGAFETVGAPVEGAGDADGTGFSEGFGEPEISETA